ncbi:MULTISPECIES: NAD(P)/FAD-dependent oxidoreductase [Xanthomonas]|uniref:NAD(P)/FAD-dependent oxidoreductase n=1 Tax=Xanthomonas rydalmerensis TaxID=3046274 RepID=A0ABZ0JHY4_9XANT|nr:MULTISPECIES: NAD(P)/FAD-dependent oxidoreductase [unclassified Xanthomonas]MBB5877279.1 thioredoxin reductase [Xanthomonas sp. 3498]MXV06001.1 NAD(P)/FAD-dependent oxidoreductase [Xanthomonas sp. LMG 9002]WOS39230.1 NAD(P)/FAD-dependent oxidoreductase [Xanthomonas sp. DM-2023]WOS43413.1 NAD(P)/FAD-dependent oxidoreductase [Xanthomonas sp. DM-2023]WOS47593.1 NAD(P)/FAD-dependent oxidoreductase [Xanthomonas sp. DM-2023]
MQHDAIIIGGSYSGMAAALQLVRARRNVLVIDAGERRNRFASHAHGFLGQDGVPPGEIAAQARRQLEIYPTLTWREERAGSVTGRVDGFEVTTADGVSHHARRILFANGVADQLPAVPGLAERWGQSVFHCPYCHGYELHKGRIGIVGSSPLSLHQAELLTEWGAVTLLVNGAVELTPETREKLEHRGVAIESTPIDRIEGPADVVLADGRQLPFAGLFAATRTSPSNALAEGIGCALEETPMGIQIRTDAESKTSVAGVFACGDVARVPHSVSLAVGSGAMAGAQVHRSLVWPETLAPS